MRVLRNTVDAKAKTSMEVWKYGSMEVKLQLTSQTDTSILPYFHTLIVPEKYAVS
jgi:hypothetical protein